METHTQGLLQLLCNGLFKHHPITVHMCFHTCSFIPAYNDFISISAENVSPGPLCHLLLFQVSKAARQEKKFQDYNSRCTFHHQAKVLLALTLWLPSFVVCPGKCCFQGQLVISVLTFRTLQTTWKIKFRPSTRRCR